MKRIVAIVAVGVATALLQVNAQETKTTEKETYPEAQEEVIGERSQPAADYQHNQYGTYPQGIDSTVLAQTRVEISKEDLPQEVWSNFENSKYSNQEIVAVYEVTDPTNAEMETMSSDEMINDPTYNNALNERSRVEYTNEADRGLTETEEQTNAIAGPRPSDTEPMANTEDAEVKYEIKVKVENQQTILTYTEEGELEEVTEKSSM